MNVDDEGRLYVAGGGTGRLFIYGIESKELIARFETGVGAFINDVTIAPNGDVYFTDSNRPFIFRVMEAQVEAQGDDLGTQVPQAIELEPGVDYGPGSNNNKLEANGIRVTPGGEYVVFGSPNNKKLYRLTPPEADPETDRSLPRTKGRSGTSGPAKTSATTTGSSF